MCVRERGVYKHVHTQGAVNRVNYNQDNTINALAGVVSLCPLVTGSTFTIKEGNGAIAQVCVPKLN